MVIINNMMQHGADLYCCGDSYIMVWFLGYTDAQNMYGQSGQTFTTYQWGFGWAWTWLNQTCWDLPRSAANFLHLESEPMLTDLTWNH